MEKSLFEQTGGTYSQAGDYLLSNLELPQQEQMPIGTWGQRYRRYLKENYRILYYNYLTAGMLNRHIAEVDKRASEMFDRLVKEFAEKENITEKLKADTPMEWVRRVNNIRSRAMEIVNSEVIFV